QSYSYRLPRDRGLSPPSTRSVEGTMPDYSKATPSFPQAANRLRAYRGNGIWQSAVILSFCARALSSFRYAACDIVRTFSGSCAQLLNSAFPTSLLAERFGKLDGRSFETQGKKI